MARSRKKRGTDWTKVSAVVSTLTAAVALLFTGLSLRETQRQSEIAERGQVTDRFNRAVEHFANSEELTKLGGIHELHSIAKDSVRDRAAVAAMLSASVRKRQTLAKPCGHEGIDTETAAVMTALADLDAGQSTDLRRSCLNQVSLPDAKLRCARLQGSSLRSASLVKADLTGALLSGAHLGEPEIRDSNPQGARLSEARIVGAMLAGARLTYAHLENADLSQADLAGANLAHARMNGARLRGANLEGADLSGADLSGADFAGAYIKDAVFSNTNITHKAAILAGALDTGRTSAPARIC